jgi:hypothetical protein
MSVVPLRTFEAAEPVRLSCGRARAREWHADALVVVAPTARRARDRLSRRVEDGAAAAEQRAVAKMRAHAWQLLVLVQRDRAHELGGGFPPRVDGTVHALRRVDGAGLACKEEAWHAATTRRLGGAQLGALHRLAPKLIERVRAVTAWVGPPARDAVLDKWGQRGEGGARYESILGSEGSDEDPQL